jgi:hypothetical protein
VPWWRRVARAAARTVGWSLADPSPRTYRLDATGGSGEHFAAVGGLAVEGGSVVVCAEVKAEGTPKVGLMLTSASGHGGLGTFDLAQGTAVHDRLADTRTVRSGSEPADGGWRRVWLEATFPPGSGPGALVVSLLDAGEGRAFGARGESILLRKLEVRRSGGASLASAREPG